MSLIAFTPTTEEIAALRKLDEAVQDFHTQNPFHGLNSAQVVTAAKEFVAEFPADFGKAATGYYNADEYDEGFVYPESVYEGYALAAFFLIHDVIALTRVQDIDGLDRVMNDLGNDLSDTRSYVGDDVWDWERGVWVD